MVSMPINLIDLRFTCFSNISKGPALNAQWINDTPVHSDVEAKLRQLLVELGDADKILGIQVHAITNWCSITM